MTAFQRDLIDLAPVVRAYALIVARGSASDADDLTQETLEKAWRHRAQFEPGTSMKAWLFTILRNAHHSQWRRSRREIEDPDGGHAARGSSEAIQGWRAEFADLLQAVNRLDLNSRQALLLITIGLTYEEAAVVCDSSLRTVQSRVRRARLRLVELTTAAADAPAPDPQPMRMAARRAPGRSAYEDLSATDAGPGGVRDADAARPFAV